MEIERPNQRCDAKCAAIYERRKKGFGCRLSECLVQNDFGDIKTQPNDALQKQEKNSRLSSSIRRFLINFFSLFVIYWCGHPLLPQSAFSFAGFGSKSRDKRAKMKICNRRFLGLVFRQNAEEKLKQRMNKLTIGCGASSRVLGQSHCFSATSIESILK